MGIHNRPTEFQDVYAFQAAMGLPMPQTPQFMDPELLAFRVKFLEEELREFISATADGDLTKAVDGLLDLVYVAHGTLAFMGLTPPVFAALWGLVHEANMQKRPAASAAESQLLTSRGHRYDVVKPVGWKSPDPQLALVLQAAGATTPEHGC